MLQTKLLTDNVVIHVTDIAQCTHIPLHAADTDCKDGRETSEAGDLGTHLGSIVVVELTQVPIVMTFSVFIPSLFKFVTGSPYTDEFENSGQVLAI